MSEQKRRFFEGNSATPTFIGAESVFVGNIRGAGHFVVSGQVHGDGDLQGGLNLSATGSWHGYIQAQYEIVAGKMVALITRRTARDLFDAHRIIAMPSLDWAKIKAATLMIGASAKSFD